MDLSQGLHGFGSSGFGQKSEQGVWDRCRESEKNTVTDWDKQLDNINMSTSEGCTHTLSVGLFRSRLTVIYIF